MKFKCVVFLLWIRDILDDLISRVDICCYPGCKNTADSWCIAGGHRHCYEHESNFYSDVEFCLVCRESMTEEEVKRELEECSVVDE